MGVRQLITIGGGGFAKFSKKPLQFLTPKPALTGKEEG